MEKFGQVDMVIADVGGTDDEPTVAKFLPIELQAVDITGSYWPSYEALTQNQLAEERSQYGFNWANVRKRFLSQLVAKGYYCHAWGTRIAAVMQEDLFTEFDTHARLAPVPLPDSHIVFMLYQFERVNGGDRFSLRLRRIVPTTHFAVMQSILYEVPPNKSAFEARILARL